MKYNLLYIVLLFVACSNEQSYSPLRIGDVKPFTRIDSTITIIDMSQNLTEIDLGKNMDKINIQYISLDASMGYIGRCDDIVIKNDNIYLLDYRGSESVFIFDKTGKCVKQLYAKGKGPEKYYGLHHMCVTDDYIILNDRLAQNVLYFSLKGEFIKKITNNVQFIDFSELSDSTQMYYSWKQQNVGSGLEEYQLSAGIIDSITHCDFPLFPLQAAAMVSLPNYFFRDINNKKSLFTTILCDTVYHMNENLSYYPKYVITNNETDWKYKNGTKSGRDKSEYVFRGFMIESPQWIYAMIGASGLVRDMYYNVKTGDLYRIMYPNNHTMVFPQSHDGSNFISYSSPSELMDLYDRHKTGEIIINDPKLLEIVANTNETGNGLLTIYSLNL